MPTALLKPSPSLPAYVAALQHGWSADNVRGRVAVEEELARVEADAAGFLASLDDPEAKGAPIPLPGGRVVERLPAVEITTDPENLVSQKVVTANGGRLVERFRDKVWHGGAESLRFRIEL